MATSPNLLLLTPSTTPSRCCCCCHYVWQRLPLDRTRSWSLQLVLRADVDGCWSCLPAGTRTTTTPTIRGSGFLWLRHAPRASHCSYMLTQTGAGLACRRGQERRRLLFRQRRYAARRPVVTMYSGTLLPLPVPRPAPPPRYVPCWSELPCRLDREVDGTLLHQQLLCSLSVRAAVQPYLEVEGDFVEPDHDGVLQKHVCSLR